MDNTDILDITIQRYIAQLEAQAAEESRSPRLRTPIPAKDIDGFFKLVGETIKRQQEIDGAKNEIFYSEEFPGKEDNLKGEAIIYSVVERKPGTFESKLVSSAMSDSNIRQRRRLFRESFADPEIPGCKLYTYGQWFDNRVEFDIVARNNKTANARALWFEDFMDSWMWLFEASGVKAIRYEGRGSDQVVTPENNKFAIRPLIYYVQTEKVTVVREHVLRSLVVTNSLE